MDALVYTLCTATTLACAILLYRGYRASRANLLLWSSVFFALITVENALLLADLIAGPSVDLALVRISIALLGVSVLIIAMICERG